jgi:hypothetical protein
MNRYQVHPSATVARAGALPLIVRGTTVLSVATAARRGPSTLAGGCQPSVTPCRLRHAPPAGG